MSSNYLFLLFMLGTAYDIKINSENGCKEEMHGNLSGKYEHPVGLNFSAVNACTR